MQAGKLGTKKLLLLSWQELFLVVAAQAEACATRCYGLLRISHGAHLPNHGDFNLAGVLHFLLDFLRNLEAQLGGALVGHVLAIQAGRELRVMVDAENVTDERAAELSFEISQKIEKEMQYPGQIKITVIREMRAVAYAK